MIIRIIPSIMLIACISTTSFAFSGHGPRKVEGMGVQYHDLGIEVKDGLISMDVKNAEIVHVLKEIARKAKIGFTIDEGVVGKISIKMTGVTLEEALKKLCENRAIVFEYLPSKNSYKIISVGAYAGKREGVVQPGERPGTVVPPSVAGGENIHDEKRKETGIDDDGKGSNAGEKKSQERLVDSKGRLLYKPGELLVRYKEGVTEKQMADLHKSLGSVVIGRMNRLRLQKIRLREGLSEQEAIEHYAASGLVDLVEKHALRYPNETIPNDTYFVDQWGLSKIQAPEAWDITQGDPEIIIAVIDTGVDYLHPDLSDNIWINTAELNGDEGVDDDENGYIDDIRGWDFAGSDEHDPDDQDAGPMDLNGHGTHVAGIIAAKGNNGLGVAGVCWNAKIMVLKVQADNGSHMEDWDVINAVYYAIDNGAQIVNCSFGGEENNSNEESAFIDLKDADILAVCAAGNDSLNTDLEGQQNYPSSYDLDNIISVAASDEYDNLASFSNYGLTSVDVMAPGFNIKSTVPANTNTEASVTIEVDSGSTQYSAFGIQYAGTTDENGIVGSAYYCGTGSDPGDFPSGVSGNIALIERDGEILFSVKATNAQNAGALAVIIYNHNDSPFDSWTLGDPSDWVPVVSMSNADGLDLKASLEAMEDPTVTVVNKPVNDPSSYNIKGGTSMAAPHVSGIAGLLLSKNTSLEYAEIKSAILDTVDKISTVSGKMVSDGRVNALFALCSITTIPGDLSCDNQVELDDAILALQVVSGLNPEICSACISFGIDVNGDGRIGIEEAIYVMQKVGGTGR